jgi:hypothetical protein
MSTDDVTPEDNAPTPLRTEQPESFVDPGVQPGDQGTPDNVEVDWNAEAERLLAEGNDPAAQSAFEGNISVDELVAAYGAAKLTAEKLTQVNARQANEIARLRATLRNVITKNKKK